MDIVQPDTELLVVTENGYGKRTPIEDYPVKGRGTMGVKTIGLTEKKGGLAGALIVREHHELVFISQNGMVQRTSVKGHLAAGPAGPGRAGHEPRDDDIVSAVALVQEESVAAPAADVPADELPEAAAPELDASADGAASRRSPNALGPGRQAARPRIRSTASARGLGAASAARRPGVAQRARSLEVRRPRSSNALACIRSQRRAPLRVRSYSADLLRRAGRSLLEPQPGMAGQCAERRVALAPGPPRLDRSPFAA